MTGLDAPVEIVRDTHAIPHIYAQSPRDGAFAMGFVHAQDRLWQMEMQRRVGAARLSEIFGDRSLNTDRFLRTLGVYRVAERNFSMLSPETRAIYQAYAAGVNAYLETRSGLLPLEFVVLGHEPEPWRPADSLVWRCHVNHRVTSLWAQTPEIMQRSSLAATVSSRRRGIGGVFGGRPDGVGR